MVDDEPLLLLVVAGFLQEHTVECVEAESAAEALGHFQPGAFDLVITDRTMPGMDGMALTGEIRKIHPPQRVLMISGMHPGDPLSAGPDGGPDAFLAKPFTRAQMLESVFQLFRDR